MVCCDAKPGEAKPLVLPREAELGTLFKVIARGAGGGGAAAAYLSQVASYADPAEDAVQKMAQAKLKGCKKLPVRAFVLEKEGEGVAVTRTDNLVDGAQICVSAAPPPDAAAEEDGDGEAAGGDGDGDGNGAVGGGGGGGGSGEVGGAALTVPELTRKEAAAKAKAKQARARAKLVSAVDEQRAAVQRAKEEELAAVRESLARVRAAAQHRGQQQHSRGGPSFLPPRSAEQAAAESAWLLQRRAALAAAGSGEGAESVGRQGMAMVRNSLPAAQQKEELVRLIRENQVVVVSGETGCGKTTQLPQVYSQRAALFVAAQRQPVLAQRLPVPSQRLLTTQLPQFILEAAIDGKGGGGGVGVLCTQPRRISALSVAERVAAERGEEVGQSVGYAIRGEHRYSAHTRLVFCTTGILLRRLQSDPLLEGVSHVIVDEVHERELNADFLLVILKVKALLVFVLFVLVLVLLLRVLLVLLVLL